METKANYVAVGSFVLVGVLGLLAALLWLAGAQYQEEYAYYLTYFSGPVTGLGKGTAVRYNGIDVGRVSQLNFDSDNPKLVIVTMQLSPYLPIHNDSVASIASEGLTGASFVEIDGGSKAAPILRPGPNGEIPAIRSKPSTLQEIEQSAPQLIAKLNHAADRLNDVLSDQNRKAFSETLGNMRDLSVVLAKRAPDIDRTLGNVSVTSASLNTDLSDLHHTLGRADKAVDDIDRVADDVDSQVNRAGISQLVSQSRALIQSMTALSNELNAQPTKLLFGDRRKGYTPP